MGCRPWGREESDTTERLHFHVSLSCIGEGNGNPLQCSCLENLRGGGAWWVAVYGVAQSRTRLKRLTAAAAAAAAAAEELGKPMAFLVDKFTEIESRNGRKMIESRMVGARSWGRGRGS